MAFELQSPLGLIAGNGSFPIEFARQAKKRGLEVIAVAHSGETDPQLEKLVSRCVWVKVGELGKLLDTFTSSAVRQVAFAGGISRVNLFGGVKLDLRAVAMISRIGSVKDDAILRGVAGELEKLGIAIVSAGVLLDQITLSAGCLTRRQLSLAEAGEARIGWQACRAIGGIDIGQTIVVSQGVVVAVEAVEGTDAAIRRGGELAGKGCVVVKLCKPGQDTRIDLPTIGVKTIETMALTGATALVLEAKKSVVLDPDAVAREANKFDIVIELASTIDDLSR